MSKIRSQLVPLVVAASLIATACINDAAGSGPADLSASESTTAPTTSEAPVPTSAPQEQSTTTSSTPADGLAFGEEEPVPSTQQLWNDVDSVVVDWTIEFESDPPLEITGGFTAGQGLTARWNDPIEGDVLVMMRGEQRYRAYRVGNEIFIAEEELGENISLFADLLTEVVEPLETGVLPPGADTFVVVDGGERVGPDVLYQLPDGAAQGTISIGGSWLIDLARAGSDVRFELAESQVQLTREEVESFPNDLLREWYFDQAS